MTRKTTSIIVTVVAIVLLAVMYGPALLLLLVVFPIAWYFSNRQEKADEEKNARLTTFQHIDEVTHRYGDPDDVVTLNASQANDLKALILFYAEHDVVVVAGHELKISELISVAPKNLATPYTFDEWAVIISTRNPDYPVITLRVGCDAGLATEIAAQINSHIA